MDAIEPPPKAGERREEMKIELTKAETALADIRVDTPVDMSAGVLVHRGDNMVSEQPPGGAVIYQPRD